MGCSASAQGDTVAATCVERSPDWSGYGEEGTLQGASAAESEYFLDYLRNEEANVVAVLGPAEVRTVYRLEKELRAEHTRDQPEELRRSELCHTLRPHIEKCQMLVADSKMFAVATNRSGASDSPPQWG
eukprot:Rhum_TRINITY_DN5801_c0_g2::Rhum_TRINITY_DN5801_c0_g2_i1::g.18388::m.18388